MGILDKAKEITDKVNESVTSFSGDEVIANTVIKAVEKQEKVNAILKEKGCNYRVADIELARIFHKSSRIRGIVAKQFGRSTEKA